MAPNAVPETSLSDARMKVPQHVVYRSFPSETVVLNLRTGKYHGLNISAGRMLQALDGAGPLRDVASELAAGYEQPPVVVERDLCELCQLLLDRDLIEIDAGTPG